MSVKTEMILMGNVAKKKELSLSPTLEYRQTYSIGFTLALDAHVK